MYQLLLSILMLSSSLLFSQDKPSKIDALEVNLKNNYLRVYYKAQNYCDVLFDYKFNYNEETKEVLNLEIFLKGNNGYDYECPSIAAFEDFDINFTVQLFLMSNLDYKLSSNFKIILPQVSYH